LGVIPARVSLRCDVSAPPRGNKRELCEQR
jgi:hypothetical protein